MSPVVNGDNYTDSQLAILRQLAKGPLVLERLNKYAINSLGLLETRGAVETDEEHATITDEGRAVLAKIDGEPSPPPQATPKSAARTTVDRSSTDGPGKVATQHRLPEGSGDSNATAATTTPAASSEPSGLLDIAKLRAAIDAEYAKDIEALDRVAEIQRAASA